MKHALVVGATGVVGRAISQQLAAYPDWRVTCATRSGKALSGATGIAVDLMDPQAVIAAASQLDRVTHMFYAAYQPRMTRSEEVEPNLTMLRHAIDLAEGTSDALQHVTLITGGKYYGLQWGAIRTPARESAPRHLGPNFYYAQHDHMVARSAAARWTWSHLVPPYVTGFSERAPMNLVMVIAVLATLAKEVGAPLRFPGPAIAWGALHHLADANQIAAAAKWAAESPAARNEIFNVANGDPGRWRNVWPTIATYFDVPLSEPLPVPLPQLVAGLGEVWRRIAKRHDLEEPDLHALVDWQWADYMFKHAFANDVIFELGKIRRAGFDGCLDSEATLLGRFDELRSLRFIP